MYVLESESTGRRYVGHTTDLSRRVAQHNNETHNIRKYTSKQAGPWRLIYQESQPTRGEAIRRERWLKSGAGRQWIQEHMDRESPPQTDLS